MSYYADGPVDPPRSSRTGSGGGRRRRDTGKRRSPLRKLLWGFFAVGLAMVTAVAVFAGYVALTANSNVTREALLPDEAASPAPTPSDAPKDPGINFLIVGSDTRPGDAGRSDVIVLAHIPSDGKKLYLIHFPRDMYVDIPGRGKDKINASYAYGGAPLLVSTMQNLLGIKIDHVAKTNMEGFRGIVDSIGGVRVYAEEPSSGKGNGGVAIAQGWNSLNGTQALGFVRERYDLKEGDIGRGKRQMALIKAVMLKATAPESIKNPVTIARFTDAATQNLVLDDKLSTGDLRGYAVKLRNVRSGDVVFVTAPISGFGRAPNGGAIDIVDQKQMAVLGHDLAYDTMEDYDQAYVSQ